MNSFVITSCYQDEYVIFQDVRLLRFDLLKLIRSEYPNVAAFFHKELHTHHMGR